MSAYSSTSSSRSLSPGAASSAAASAEPDKTTAFYKTLTENAYQYYCKAMYYYKENEIEGSLINFLLALNNLYNVKTLLSSDEYQKLFQDAKSESLQAKQGANEDSKKTLITSNFKACEQELTDMDKNIENAIDKVLSYVKTLQEQLKRIKNDRGTGSGPNKEDDVPCKDVKQDFISGNALTFDDVSGQDIAKDQIRSGILYPLIHPRLYPNSSKGILFYGPPGTGKTLLAKAFVNQLQKEIMNSKVDIRIIFYAPTGAELKGKYVGETEKKITNYFRCAASAATSCTKGVMKQNREARPDKLQTKVISVLFIDEVEAIAGNRDKDESGLMTNSVNALLQMMDGVSSNENVIVMAATNYPWKLDEAVLRRFDTKIYIKLPTAEDIEQVIKSDIATNYIMKALTKPKNILPNLNQSSAEEKTGKLLQNKDTCTKVTEKEVEDKLPESLKVSCDDGKVCLTPYTGDAEALHPVKVFDFYRKLYFPEFTDQQIRLYSQNLAKNHYSGGDVKNICRYVYKLMGNRAKKIGRFNTETGILNPKQLKKSDQPELDKIKVKTDIEKNPELFKKIIYNACSEGNNEYQPFEFKTFHTGGSIDMRHYSHSEEPSFLILHKENGKEATTEIKEEEQRIFAELMRDNTSVFFSKLKQNQQLIDFHNGTLFMKFDVIPDKIIELVEAFLVRHPLTEQLIEKLGSKIVKLQRELNARLQDAPVSLRKPLQSVTQQMVGNIITALHTGVGVAGLGFLGVTALGVTGLAATAIVGTAALGTAGLAKAAVDYLVNDPNGLEIVKLKNNISKIKLIISELRNIEVVEEDEKDEWDDIPDGDEPAAVSSPLAAPAQAAVEPAPHNDSLKKYKEYIKKYLLSMYSTLDQLFQSCKNNSQKTFYISYNDFTLMGSPPTQIFIPEKTNKNISIMIHQQLSIHPKLSVIPFKKDIWLHISLQDDLLDGVWNSLRRGMASYSSGVKSFFTDYVPGKVSGALNWAISWAITSNEIANMDLDKLSNTNNQEIDFVKMKTLEDASRMTNIYKMAISIFCFEEGTQISQLACVQPGGSGKFTYLFNDKAQWNNSPAYCFSQGKLWREDGNCGDLTEAIRGFQNIFKKDSTDKRKLLKDDFTLNRFLEKGISELSTSIFKDKIYFTDPSKKEYTANQNIIAEVWSLYKHMYMIKDATPEEVYINISENIERKFPSRDYTKFIKFQRNGTTIDESEGGENGTIQTIKSTSYFFKNSTGQYHELFTLSYPDLDIISAKNEIVDHRTLVYKNVPSVVDLGGNLNCLDELEDSRYINFSFNYADFMTAINFTNTDSIKPTVKQIRVSQLDAYSRNEDIPKDPNDK